MSDYTNSLLSQAMAIIATFLTGYGVTITQGQIQQVVAGIGVVVIAVMQVRGMIMHHSAVTNAVAAAPGTSLTAATTTQKGS